MVLVYIQKALLLYEADIRDLCMAYFVLNEIIYFYENDSGNYVDNKGDAASVIKSELQKKYKANDIIEIKNFFEGNLSTNRKLNKIEIKKQLYIFLHNITHKKLLWGTLTGIRPVTIVIDFILKQNKKDSSAYKKIGDILKNDYYVSDEKINELIEISKNEISILNRQDIKDYKDKYSIYIGIPFCKSTCLYCSFTSFNIDKYNKYVDKFLLKLESELKNNVYNLPMSIYIGGGTPTSLDENSFEKLLEIVDKYINKKNCLEYTIEAGRPDTITKEKLCLMKKYGVSRISINPQTFNQKTLDIIGRKHTVNDVVEKYYMARDLGFDNINMDIIIGLPNEHLKEVKQTVKWLKKLKPDSLTIHSLAIKRSARLNKEISIWSKDYYLAGLNENKIRIFGRDLFINFLHREIDKMFFICKKCAKSIGLIPYYLYRQKNMAGNLENIGYASYGKECIYNIMMMEENHTVYGFGTASTKYVAYKDDEKIVNNIEGYKSVIDYCTL